MRTLFAAIALMLGLGLSAQGFDKHFADSTLRLDYIFGGVADKNGSIDCHILFDGAIRTPGWAGRRHNLNKVPLRGNGRLALRDIVTGDTIYATSFSTLFQEWLGTAEGMKTPRPFENSFLVPMPHDRSIVEITLFDSHGRPMGDIWHIIDPSDILIADRSAAVANPHRVLHKGGDSAGVIDVAILAEGYTEAEADRFYADAQTAVDAILAHEPFRSRAGDFNFVAVAAPSDESGVSIPRLGQWKSTAVGSNFSTFYSDRYLTTDNVKAIHNCLVNIPYEHIIILANTPEYGGGGIYNFYTLTTAGHANFRPVVVHEFGHSFGGLGDEYFYDNDDVDVASYNGSVEPWEQNLTTMADFASKWQDMLIPDTPVPTSPSDAVKYPVGVFEGGGYRSKGVYRPADDCRMRTNTAPAFCPVCARAIDRLIDFYVK